MSKNPTKTERAIWDMMTVNTGRAMCDSGGTPSYDEDGNYTGSSSGYGRAYERLAKIELDTALSVPDVTVRWGSYGGLEPEVTVSMFKFLAANLGDYMEGWTENLRRFNARDSEKYNSFGESLMHWFDQRLPRLAQLAQIENCAPRYDAEDYDSIAAMRDLINIGSGDNTYNGESLLSGVFQYTLFEIDGEHYVALQSHNGADVK